MRAFIFAIGGTGSRVLNAMIMQLAAGVRPETQDGEVIDSIVPIIIDPHADNGGLQELTQLLDNYRAIRKKIHGDATTKETDGFFSVKVETLKDAEPTITRGDKFYFRMNNVSDHTFSQFIGEKDMSKETSHLVEILYSESEMNTNMKEGFYGSPNIGCVALNDFSHSEDFKAFCQAYKEGDKLFFIGSIFGGTGASGLPLFISTIRDLHDTRNRNLEVTGTCAKAPIGALIVMPYFSIAPDPESPINEQDWMIKSRSALNYYATNMNDKINDIYYLADPAATEAIPNDPGNIENQKGNKAHIVELIGADAIFHFLKSYNIGCSEGEYGRIFVENPHYYQYGLATTDSSITFKGIPSATLEVIEKPMMEFHLLRYFMQYTLPNRDQMGAPYAKGISETVLPNKFRELGTFFALYDKWIAEMKSHGVTAHNLNLFSDYKSNDYSGLFKDISTQKRKVVGYKSVDDDDLRKSFNSVSEKYKNKTDMNPYKRWFTIAHEGLNDVIKNNYNLI